MRTMNIISNILLSSVAAVMFFAATSFAASVEIRSKEGIGSYLADEKGMALYLFKKDTVGNSACAGPCVEKWPLFAPGEVTVPDGVKAADFGVITRGDGNKQATYKGLPLYYFFKDKAAGDTFGQGVNDVWYIVAP